MKLTSTNVEAIFMDCLFKDEEDKSNPVIAEGIVNKFGFHRERLESHREEIKGLLHELPEAFQEGKGGGWSFLNACQTKDGDPWGEHQNMEQLLALGIGTGQAKVLMPRARWGMFPGGMPYFSVSAKEVQS